MALTTCKECGKELSDRAYSCPHCGVKLRQTNADIMITLLFIVAFLLLWPVMPWLSLLIIPVSLIVIMVRIFKYRRAVKEGESKLRQELFKSICENERIKAMNSQDKVVSD